MVNQWIAELVQYGIANELVKEVDRIYCINQLLELFSIEEFQQVKIEGTQRPLHEILEDLLDYANETGVLELNTPTYRDLFDTKIMNVLTPIPSNVVETFDSKYNQSPQDATDYFYELGKKTNYIRTNRIAKDEKWTVQTEYGLLDITINLSKPEKDPREIALAGKQKQTSYPNCLLCKENVGYAGSGSHPARQNHRIIPVELLQEAWSLQYSPYVYYNEHCILLNNEHTPMHIDRSCFAKLLAFVAQFPHYIIGSNADLPIVGGSILSHDHYQGGCYEFAMAKAPEESKVYFEQYDEVEAVIVKWPLSVLRIKSKNSDSLVSLADDILTTWRSYTDETAFIFAQSDETLHNTITPIARFRDGNYELDLVLRNNITTQDSPYGRYHPRESYHHIKKENIGLIEVMGLAILPARLKQELQEIKECIENNIGVSSRENIEKHSDWVDKIIAKYGELPADQMDDILREEVGIVFKQVLEDAGVYKCDKQGREGFMRFIQCVNTRVRN